MDLERDREAWFESFDQADLPERTSKVQWARRQVLDVGRDLRVATRSGQGRPGDVIVQLERAIVDPSRSGQSEERPGEALGEVRQAEDPLPHDPLEFGEVGRLSAKRQHPGQLHAILGVLHLEERVVERAEPLSHLRS